MKKYTINAKRSNFGCPKGSEVMEALESGKKLDPKKITILTAPGKSTQVKLCMGKAEARNAFANVIGVTDDTGAAQAATVLEDTVKIGYDVTEISLQGGVIQVKLDELAPVTVTGDLRADVAALADDIVARGINSRAEIDEKISEMRKNRVSDGTIIKVLKSAGYKAMDDQVIHPRTMYVDPNPNEKPSVMAKCLVMALSSHRFIAEGDKSVGKNVMTEELAWLLNLRYSIKTMSRYLTYEDIFGNMKTEAPELAIMDDGDAVDLAKAAVLANVAEAKPNAAMISDAARFEVLRAKAATIRLTREITDFTKWIIDGGMMCLNEVNLADPNFLASFVNQLTDGTGFIEIAGVGRAYLNEKAILVGNRNKGYTGTQTGNEATMSRFPVVRFDYPTSIKDILKSAVKTPLDDAYLTQCDNFYVKCRAAVQKKQISNQSLNIRGFVAALEAVAQFSGDMPLNEALKLCVIYLVESDEEQAALIQMMADVVNL